MVFIFGEKKPRGQSDSVILSFPILLNSSYWSSWKTVFFGDVLRRETLDLENVLVAAGWIVGIGFNVLINLNLFLYSQFFRNLLSKCLMHVTAEEVGCESFQLTNLTQRFLISWSLFFSIWVFFHKRSRSTGQQRKGEGIYLTPLYHFHPLGRHWEINRVIAAESSPLHIASSQTRTWNLWFPSASC